MLSRSLAVWSRHRCLPSSAVSSARRSASWTGSWSGDSGGGTARSDSRYSLGRSSSRPTGVDESLDHFSLACCIGPWPALGDQWCDGVPGDVSEAAVPRLWRRVCLQRRCEVGHVQLEIRMMVAGELEVVGDLVSPVATRLGFQLDDPQPVVPQHGIVGCTALLIFTAPRSNSSTKAGAPAGQSSKPDSTHRLSRNAMPSGDGVERVFHRG